MMKNLMTYMRVLPVIATFYIVEKNVISVSNAEGVSMQPTISSGDIVIIDKFTHKYFNPLKKGDIVIAVQPVNPQVIPDDIQVQICKRIVELGGGRVDYAHGLKVPQLYYWIEGDNKKHSYDSRHHGCVPENLIIGRVAKIIHL